jgi:hypothetical protein
MPAFVFRVPVIPCQDLSWLGRAFSEAGEMPAFVFRVPVIPCQDLSWLGRAFSEAGEMPAFVFLRLTQASESRPPMRGFGRASG